MAVVVDVEDGYFVVLDVAISVVNAIVPNMNSCVDNRYPNYQQ